MPGPHVASSSICFTGSIVINWAARYTSFLARKEVAINNPEIKVYNPKEYNFRIINRSSSKSITIGPTLASNGLGWSIASSLLF